MTQIYDTIIIGSGPIGNYLAQKLALGGLRVMVLDKKNNLADAVCCTGIISPQCFDKLSLDGNIRYRPYKSASLFGPQGQNLHFQRHKTVALVVDRPALNELLAARAAAAGVEVVRSTKAVELHTLNDCIDVKAMARGGIIHYRGKMAVLANGFDPHSPLYPFQQHKSRFTIGIQSLVEVFDCIEPQIYVDREIAPGGFGWLVPTWGNSGLAGVFCSIKPKQHLECFLQRLKTTGIISSYSARPASGLIPLGRPKHTYGERLLVVGEAAGQVKPTTGGGIYFGLLCADIAAGIIHQAIQGQDFSSRLLREYQTRWHKLLKNELTAGYIMQFVWSRLGNQHLEQILNIMHKQNFARTVETCREFHFDWHSRVMKQQAMRYLLSFKW